MMQNCSHCYPTTIDNNFFILFSGFTKHNSKWFLYFAWVEADELTTVGKGFLLR